MSTFGLGVGFLLRRVPTKVISATNTAALSIFLRIVWTTGGCPATPSVSLSTMTSRAASSKPVSPLTLLQTSSKTSFKKPRPTAFGVSDCHEKNTEFAIELSYLASSTSFFVPFAALFCFFMVFSAAFRSMPSFFSSANSSSRISAAVSKSRSFTAWFICFSF